MAAAPEQAVPLVMVDISGRPDLPEATVQAYDTMSESGDESSSDCASEGGWLIGDVYSCPVRGPSNTQQS
tara:strand:- start:284 stop:493 length:210 start_codon:yes stop_codon:yes gene_type:complete